MEPEPVLLMIILLIPIHREIISKCSSEALNMYGGRNVLNARWILMSSSAVIACCSNREAQAQSQSQEPQDYKMRVAASVNLVVV
jgi:uncharacterized membrane protein